MKLTAIRLAAIVLLAGSQSAGAEPLALDLADIVGGGNGLGTGGYQGIDPRNGSIVLANREVYLGGIVKNRYNRVPDLPFVDGVFVPDGGSSAQHTVPLSSAGHWVANFRDTNARSWDFIWNGGPRGSHLSGVDYESTGHSMIDLHANKGITFDLDAIEAAYPGLQVERFTAMAGMTNVNRDIRRPDVWVFVDGVEVFKELSILDATAYPVDIAIGPESRFLTLIGTDGDNGSNGDWTMFGDPHLQMVPEPCTLALLAMGAVALLAYALKRRQN